MTVEVLTPWRNFVTDALSIAGSLSPFQFFRLRNCRKAVVDFGVLHDDSERVRIGERVYARNMSIDSHLQTFEAVGLKL